MGFFKRQPQAQADATVTNVKMTRRIDYGNAKVLVTYRVLPMNGDAFDVQVESKVKMATLPQAGQEVRVAYDPNRPERVEVLTPPGQEAGTVTEKTAELGWNDPHMPRATESEVQQLRQQIASLEQQQQAPPEADQ
jgi:hypothetical protein